MIKKLDYNEDLEIDGENLELEWHRHGHMFMKYVEVAALIEEEKNNAKAATQVVRSGIAKEIRRRPRKFGFDSKPTDKAIKDVVEAHGDTIAADKRLFSLIRKEVIFSKAMHAMGSYRKTALEHLTSMRLSGYSAKKYFKAKPTVDQRNRFFGDQLDEAAQKARYALNEPDPFTQRQRKIIRRKK